MFSLAPEWQKAIHNNSKALGQTLNHLAISLSRHYNHYDLVPRSARSFSWGNQNLTAYYHTSLSWTLLIYVGATDFNT